MEQIMALGVAFPFALLCLIVGLKEYYNIIFSLSGDYIPFIRLIHVPVQYPHSVVGSLLNVFQK
jgi:hypothetical protein